MKFLILILFLSCFQPTFSQDFTVSGELKKIEDALEKLKNDSTKSWYESEWRFFNHWANGLRAEIDEEYNTAIQHYEMAINQYRGELPTYYPLFSMGRAGMKIGNKEFSKQCFSRFVEHATSELKYDNPYKVPEEFKNQLRLQIAEAQKSR